LIHQSNIWNTNYYLSINSARVTIARQTTLIRIGNSVDDCLDSFIEIAANYEVVEVIMMTSLSC